MPLTEVPPPKIPDKKKKPKVRDKHKDSVNQQIRRATEKAEKLRRELERTEKTIEAAESVKDVLTGKAPAIVTAEAVEKVAPTALEAALKDDNIIFRPNPGPQTDFLASTEDEVFYGGARGGGKSYAMLADPVRECGKSSHRGLILRRTMPELRDMIHKSQLLYPKAYPGAKWKEQDKEWRFPSGARMEFGYAENLADALRYQGQSYTWIGVDELPQYPTPDVWNFLRSSLRSVDPAIKPVMRASGNPGNVGSGWVKEMFIDPAPANTRFTVEVTFQTPTGPRKKNISRRYIPAKVWDNPYLTYDDSYIAVLASLPETQRKQFLEGNWDVFEGAAFPEFDRNVHVVAPYDIPSNFPRFRAADWGYSSPACCLWFAVDWDNNLIVYRELYGKGRTADVFAKTVMEMEAQDRVPYGILDASTWANRGDVGPSIAETMNRLGCRWRPSDRSPRSRISGKLEVHRRLAVDPATQKPRLFIFNNCVNLIRTLSTIPIDKHNAEDVDTKADDHAYDALRYGCQSRPMFGRMTQHSAPEPEPTPADSEFGY